MSVVPVSDCEHRRLTRDTDPDCAYCIDCFHTIYLNVPLQAPNQAASARCPDCKAGVARQGVRCRVCAQKRAHHPGPRGQKREPVAIAPREFWVSA